MGSTVFVKVVGFRDVERHALNTLFRMSVEQPVCYALWTPESPVMPHIGLIDVDNYEAGLALASPSLNRNLKLICVGEGAPERAWRKFSRPINWTAVLHAMNQLFAPVGVDISIDLDDENLTMSPPGVRQTLIVDPSKEDCMYLRARLSLAGLIEVSEASTVQEAQTKARERHYEVVIVNVDMDGEPWALVDRLIAMNPPIGSVVVTSANHSWEIHERAEAAGCRAVLERPYDPSHLYRVLLLA